MRRQSHAWTPEEDARLDELTDAHMAESAIARRLGRTVAAIEHRRFDAGLDRPMTLGWTAHQLEALFGVSEWAIRHWRTEGWLLTHPIGTGRIQLADEEDVVAFLDDADHWPEWEPENLSDDRLRAYARDLRRGVSFLTPSEVGRALGLSDGAVYWHIHRGSIRAVRRWDGDLLVRADWLEEARASLGQRKRAGRRLFDAEEAVFVRTWRPYQPVGPLAAALERAPGTVERYCKRHGLSGPTVPPKERNYRPHRAIVLPYREFTADEEEFLRLWGPVQPARFLAVALERSALTVERYVQRHELLASSEATGETESTRGEVA